MKKPRIEQDDAPGGLTHNPFAALRPGGAAEPVSPAAADEPKASPEESAPLARYIRYTVFWQGKMAGNLAGNAHLPTFAASSAP